ncbi:hypothetical protein F4778DRAFT_730774 [Xylariomycetidae sp. FL2044]|nr:hypothetical protein F4778DRAFT_730774 [Xylariomycetidae sp. FL2044]
MKAFTVLAWFSVALGVTATPLDTGDAELDARAGDLEARVPTYYGSCNRAGGGCRTPDTGSPKSCTSGVCKRTGQQCWVAIQDNGNFYVDCGS